MSYLSLDGIIELRTGKPVQYNLFPDASLSSYLLCERGPIISSQNLPPFSQRGKRSYNTSRSLRGWHCQGKSWQLQSSSMSWNKKILIQCCSSCWKDLVSSPLRTSNTSVTGLVSGGAGGLLFCPTIHKPYELGGSLISKTGINGTVGQVGLRISGVWQTLYSGWHRTGNTI